MKLKKIELNKDTLFHNRIDKMNLTQQCYYDVMLKVNHIVNCALKDDRERSTGECMPMQFTSFLKKIGQAYESTLVQNNKCGSFVIFDDFVRIAAYGYDAIKEIVKNPSTHIEKIPTKMLANKATGFGTKTMRWMSQRPGRTIREKISPENKVLTTKTIFSADTKENRELMYLYRIIHEAIAVRVHNTKCSKCSIESDCEYKDWMLKIQKLIAMNLKIKTSELGNVKPIKQSYQNNKLMCDKNYKIVWDSVKMLSSVEEKITCDYNTSLESRVAVLIFWIILSKLSNMKGILIDDFVGKVIDEKGYLKFVQNKTEHTKIRLLKVDESGNFVDFFSICLDGYDIYLENKNGDKLFNYNVEDFFQVIEKMVQIEYAKVSVEASENSDNVEQNI